MFWHIQYGKVERERMGNQSVTNCLHKGGEGKEATQSNCCPEVVDWRGKWLMTALFMHCISTCIQIRNTTVAVKDCWVVLRVWHQGSGSVHIMNAASTVHVRWKCLQHIYSLLKLKITHLFVYYLNLLMDKPILHVTKYLVYPWLYFNITHNSVIYPFFMEITHNLRVLCH